MLKSRDFQGANFQEDNLRNANLAGATLTGLGPAPSQLTDFNGVNFLNANFAGAICGTRNYITTQGAHLHGASGVPSSCGPALDPPSLPAWTYLALVTWQYSPSAWLAVAFMAETLAGIGGALLIVRRYPPRQ